jgi:hypothetical protein
MRLVALIVAVTFAGPAAAAEDLVWILTSKFGRPYLQGQPDAPGTDADLWAHCRPDGRIDVGLAADAGVGKGNGEAVALTLTSAGQRAKVSGVSRNSENFEMTAGTELRATLSRQDRLFAVLSTGRSIAVTGAIKPLNWPVKGLKAKVAAFLKTCRR